MADSDTPDGDMDADDVPESIFANSGPDREEMIAAYLPESDDWEAKTILDLDDPRAVAALKNMDKMYPEVEGLQPLIDSFLEEFLKSRTSVGGQSREDFRDMLISMFGGDTSDNDGSTALQLVAAEDD